MNMKLLSENMLRFGTKNLSEGAKRNLVLESVMQTIKEHGLHYDVKRRLMVEFANGKTAEEVFDMLWDSFSNFGESDLLGVVNALQHIKTGTDYNTIDEMLVKKGYNMVTAMKKYLPGIELTKTPTDKKTHALDELMRINYPGQYNAAVKAGTIGRAWGDGCPYSIDNTMYKGILTNNTTWQKTKKQWGGEDELRGGGG